MNSSSQRTGKPVNTEVASIQILRGLAALVVVLGHTIGKIKHEYPKESIPQLFLDLWHISALGVDIFFVLSGLIMVLVTKDIQNNKENIQSFIKKRIIRIYPIYWIAFLAYLFLLLLSNLMSSSSALGNIQFLPLISSILLLPTMNGDSYYPYLGIAWTLTFEVFFYIVYASLLALSIYSRLIYLSIIFGCLVLMNLLLTSSFSNPYFQYYTNPIILEFLAGCWIGYLYKRRLILDVKYSALLGIFALSLIAFSSQLGTPYVSFYNLNSWRFVVWGLPSIMLVYAVLSAERILFQTVAFRPMVKLGDASYSLYLFHAAVILPVLGVIFSALKVYDYINIYYAVVILSISCIAGAYLIYVRIELPLTSILKKRMLCNENTLSPQNSV